MKITARLVCLAVLGSGVSVALAQHSKEVVEYVSPNIGGIGQLLTATIPYVQRPHGMARLAPVVTPGIGDRYLADKIYGFPAGPALLMASVGETGAHPENYASAYDHDFETATPYYYEADLQSWDIRAEFTAAKQAAYYRFTFPAGAHAHLALTMKKDSELHGGWRYGYTGERKNNRSHHRRCGQCGTNERVLLRGVLANRFPAIEPGSTMKLRRNQKQSGDSIGFVTDTATSNGEQIEVRVGVSYISEEQAHRNLEREIPKWTFEQVRSNARSAWNDTLSQVHYRRRPRAATHHLLHGSLPVVGTHDRYHRGRQVFQRV
jgi:putative alpha-1,2-mannosidase